MTAATDRMDRLARRGRRLAAGAVGLAMILAACSSPCDKIAERTCAAKGESTSACTELRAKAARATPDDRRACEQALDLADRLGGVE